MSNIERLKLEGWEIAKDYTYGKSFTYNYPEKEFYVLNDDNGEFILNYWKQSGEIYSIDMLYKSKDLDRVLIEHEKHLNRNVN